MGLHLGSEIIAAKFLREVKLKLQARFGSACWGKEEENFWSWKEIKLSGSDSRKSSRETPFFQFDFKLDVRPKWLNVRSSEIGRSSKLFGGRVRPPNGVRPDVER
ncbi:hypothetical protein LR48_Vigan06g000300 [Vigna angularis]|uniref:Uncharacterized protein n=1 Tax=Phaseolus angularis TaxID=3914 RepID=A0A0L9UPM0_PHAAN|nr:hypothetical protein LR48_Vigan06g000300 [Vigna angularis]